MTIQYAVETNCPVLDGVWDDGRVRIFCNACFDFHYHGSEGMKVPHCLFSARWYYVRVVDELPDAHAYRMGSGNWRVRCSRGKWHHSKVLGPISHPHLMFVAAAPPPGSPVFCTETGRFFDLRSGDEVGDPGYAPLDAARYGYLDRV